MRTSGNTVLITGGSSGIGLALAHAFAEAGNTVLICGRDEEKLARVKESLPGCQTYRCDLGSDEELRGLCTRLEAEHPSLNVLINNAGVQYNYRLVEEPEVWRRIDEEVGVNLSAQMKLTVALLPLLMRQASAVVVNVTSALSVVPKESAPVYCATKAGLRAFTKSLRYQLEGTAVRVVEVIPPLVDTAMTRGRGKRKVPPERVAQAVLAGLAAEKKEIRVSAVKALFAINRVLPGVAESMMRHG